MESVTKHDSLVYLTPSAAEQVRSLLSTEPCNAGKTLRVFVEGGGCSGMQYGLQFDERRDGDTVADCDGVSVLIDAYSADYLKGAVIDYKDDLNDSGFKIQNPNARQSCGCGNSFET
jgi:iron-sulfur cluster assembly accessory protein